MLKRCQNCQRDNDYSNKFCVFCGTPFPMVTENPVQPISPVSEVVPAPLPEPASASFSLKDVGPMILIVATLLFFVILTMNYKVVDASTKQISPEQQKVTEGMEKVRYRNMNLNIPATYKAKNLVDSVVFTSEEKGFNINLALVDAPYGNIKHNRGKFKELFEDKNYRYINQELVNGMFEYLLFEVERVTIGKEARAYIVIARYDKDHSWLFTAEALGNNTITEAVLSDAQWIVLGVKSDF